jgi:hypothetical protein
VEIDMKRRNGMVVVGLVGLMALSAQPSLAEDKSFSLGVEGHGRTEPSDVGLPAYPGATPYTENRDDQAAVTLGAWAGSFGMRLHVLKYQTTDSPARVAAFYAKALGRYGDVLDCRDPAARAKPPKDQPERLRCDDNAPRAGEYEYRAGTSKQFRVVHVKPEGEGTRFEMVRLVFGN